ncbi:zinc finger bed domain-containing protein ricesleeper 2-like [Gigaspora margarita]|uniref:Zinc finger bed domain-containing protein ricesleeper 2-like n=1 Tax=Gigaspora margarita TaxID=4874 RepID=A0A8H4AP78_GIGMA|nr:zinc finger bed domain-containing protein ricesleeper 2-like [Gigaspora margarita]
MSESFDSNIINDFFNTIARISDNSNTTSQTPILDIIDESSNTSKSIWDYFNKVKKSNKVIAKCKHCKNAKYSVTNGATTNYGGISKECIILFLFTEESFRQWMAEWIIFEDFPFTIIEGRFKSMIERALKIKVVSADTIQRDILQKYLQIHDNIRQELQASSKLAFTLDIWTSISVKAYIGITIHLLISYGLFNKEY